jgi:hypothetical protein
MKKTRAAKAGKSLSQAMRKEYMFDYSKARPNRFASRMTATSPMVVLVDADLAEVFDTPESVNRALRALISAVPTKKRKLTTV